MVGAFAWGLAASIVALGVLGVLLRTDRWRVIASLQLVFVGVAVAWAVGAGGTPSVGAHSGAVVLLGVGIALGVALAASSGRGETPRGEDEC